MESADFVGKLILFFNPKDKPSEAWMIQAVKELRRFDLKALDEAYNAITKGNRYFPTLDVILGACNASQEAINVAKLAQFKEEERRAARQMFDGSLAKDDFGRKCCRNITQLLTGAITREEFVKTGERLGINMTVLRKYYVENDLPLDKVAGSQWRFVEDEPLGEMNLTPPLEGKTGVARHSQR